MGDLTQQYVNGKLDVTCEALRVDIGSLRLNFRDKQQISGRDLRNVSTDADGGLIENNGRNDQLEYLLSQLSDAIMWLRGEMGSRNDTQKIQETQRQIGKT